jgi:hypothetical protein
MGTNMQCSYETDFAAWAEQQAMLLRLGKWEALDQEHLAEELEGLRRSEQNELEHRLEVLTIHLLKWRQWQEQPMYPDPRRGWRLTILEQRRRLARLLHRSPSLRPSLVAVLSESYPYARRIAHEALEDIGLRDITLPEDCPWTVEQVLDDDFWPEAMP